MNRVIGKLLDIVYGDRGFCGKKMVMDIEIIILNNGKGKIEKEKKKVKVKMCCRIVIELIILYVKY